MEPPPLTYTAQVGPKPNGTGLPQGRLLYIVQTLTENIGRFGSNPKNGMLPSPPHGAHPLPKASNALVSHRVKAQKSMTLRGAPA